MNPRRSHDHERHVAACVPLAGSVDEIIVEALSRKTQMIRTVLSE